MSWQNILALAVFVAVCGFIAYIGDLLGRRMGKRRLSLFGLRPRYTAIVTTSITGMLIAILTITVMAIASKEFQKLVLRGTLIIRELEDKVHTTQDAYSKVEKELAKERKVVSLTRAQAAQAVKQRNSLAAEVKRIDSVLRGLRAELRRNKDSLARTERTLGQAQANLSTAKKEVAEKKLLISQQEAAIAQLEANRSELAMGLARLRREYGQEYNELRGGKVIFDPNQDIARTVINCAQAKNAIRAEMIRLLDEASERAKQEGAIVGVNGRAVVFLQKVIEGQKHVYLESEMINAIVDNIYGGSGSVVVRIYAFGNAFEGEQAAVECELIANRLVYSAGDEVASTVIDGRASNGTIFSGLVLFLQTEVRSAAIYRGIVPTLTESGQLSVGQLDDWDEVFDLVLRIKAAGKEVRVKAVAARETWSAGPLPVDFAVEGL